MGIVTSTMWNPHSRVRFKNHTSTRRWQKSRVTNKSIVGIVIVRVFVNPLDINASKYEDEQAKLRNGDLQNCFIIQTGSFVPYLRSYYNKIKLHSTQLLLRWMKSGWQSCQRPQKCKAFFTHHRSLPIFSDKKRERFLGK